MADGTAVCLTAPPSDLVTKWTLGNYVPCPTGGPPDMSFYIYVVVNDGCVDHCTPPAAPAFTPPCNCPTGVGMNCPALNGELVLDLSNLLLTYYGDGVTLPATISDYLLVRYQPDTECTLDYSPQADTSVRLVNWYLDFNEAGQTVRVCGQGGWFVKDAAYSRPVESDIIIDSDTIPMVPAMIHKQDAYTAFVPPGTDCYDVQYPTSDTSCVSAFVAFERATTHNTMILFWSTDSCQWIFRIGSTNFLGPWTPNDPRGRYDMITSPDCGDCNKSPSGGPCLSGFVTIA